MGEMEDTAKSVIEHIEGVLEIEVTPALLIQAVMALAGALVCREDTVSHDDPIWQGMLWSKTFEAIIESLPEEDRSVVHNRLVEKGLAREKLPEVMWVVGKLGNA